MTFARPTNEAVADELRAATRAMHEAGARNRPRQNAGRLCLLANEADGPRISDRVHAGIDAETNAGAWRVRRQIHDRLPRRISGELVRPRETFFGPFPG